MTSKRESLVAGALLLALLALVTADITVGTPEELSQALGGAALGQVLVAGSVALGPDVLVDGDVVLTSPGHKGVLDLAHGTGGTLSIRRGTLTLRGLTLSRFWPDPAAAPGAAAAAASGSPLAGVALAPGATLRIEDCVFHATVPLAALAAAAPFWAAALAEGAVVGADGAKLSRATAAASAAAAAVDYKANVVGGGGGGNGPAKADVSVSILLIDPSGCFSPGSGPVVSDTASLAAAVGDAAVGAATVVGPVSVGAPANGRPGAKALRALYTAPPLARRLALAACPGAALDFFGAALGALVVGRGGELELTAPLVVASTAGAAAAATAAATAGNSSCLAAGTAAGAAGLLPEVAVLDGGVLKLSGVQLSAPGAAAAAEAALKSGAALQLSGGKARQEAVVVANGSIPLESGGQLVLSDASLSDATPGCFGSAAVDAVVSDTASLRAALSDPAVRRIEVASDLRLVNPLQGRAAGLPWGPAPAAGTAPGSPAIVERELEIRGCMGGSGSRSSSGGSSSSSSSGRWVFDLADAIGALVVARGGALRISGALLLRPCTGRAAACLAAWPALPAVALAPGAQLELEGVVIEAPTPSPWDFGASSSAGAPAAFLDRPGCAPQLSLRRLVIPASDLWSHLSGGKPRGRRLARRLMQAKAGAGQARAGEQEAYYIYAGATLAVGAAAGLPLQPPAQKARVPAAAIAGGTVGAVALAAAVVVGAVFGAKAAAKRRAARRAAAAACSTPKGTISFAVGGSSSTMYGRRGGGRAALAPSVLTAATSTCTDGSGAACIGGSAAAGGKGGSDGSAYVMHEHQQQQGRQLQSSSGSREPLTDPSGRLSALSSSPVILRSASAVPKLSGGLAALRARGGGGDRAAAAAGTPPGLLNGQPGGVMQCPSGGMFAPRSNSGAPTAGGMVGTRSGGSGSGARRASDEQQQRRQRQFESAAQALQSLHQSRHTQEDLVLESVLGEGTFGMVYRAWWKGSLVAVKRMLFPAGMSGAAKRERMAVMEMAISSRLRHPNVVQLYSFYLRPLAAPALQDAEGRMRPQPDDGSFASLPGETGEELARAFLAGDDDAAVRYTWEVQLVLEYCDRGSLRALLNTPGSFTSPDGTRNMLAVVSCALDVAKAMLHLHSTHVVHSDLKARNVLLKTASTDDDRGFVAKVADFGLSIQLPEGASHVSGTFQGTMTHMAPEVMSCGRVSKASDVYAFGILLWELFTGQQPFKGIPRALLGHEVAQLHCRPDFPPGCPFDYLMLACRCWESDYTIRPCFQDILDQLQRMRARLRAAAAGVDPCTGLSTASCLLTPPVSAAAVAAARSAGAAAASGREGGGGLQRAASDEALTLRTLSRTEGSMSGTDVMKSLLALRSRSRSRSRTSARGATENRSYYISQAASSSSEGAWGGGDGSSSDGEARRRGQESAGVSGGGGGGHAAAAAAQHAASPEAGSSRKRHSHSRRDSTPANSAAAATAATAIGGLLRGLSGRLRARAARGRRRGKALDPDPNAADATDTTSPPPPPPLPRPASVHWGDLGPCAEERLEALCQHGETEQSERQQSSSTVQQQEAPAAPSPPPAPALHRCATAPMLVFASGGGGGGSSSCDRRLLSPPEGNVVAVAPGFGGQAPRDESLLGGFSTQEGCSLLGDGTSSPAAAAAAAAAAPAPAPPPPARAPPQRGWTPQPPIPASTPGVTAAARGRAAAAAGGQHQASPSTTFAPPPAVADLAPIASAAPSTTAAGGAPAPSVQIVPLYGSAANRAFAAAPPARLAPSAARHPSDGGSSGWLLPEVPGPTPEEEMAAELDRIVHAAAAQPPLVVSGQVLSGVTLPQIQGAVVAASGQHALSHEWHARQAAGSAAQSRQHSRDSPGLEQAHHGAHHHASHAYHHEW